MIDPEIVALESELRAAMLAGDVAVLDRLVDDDLIFTMPTGAVVGKADDLDAHRSRRMLLTRLHLVDQHILHFGGTAVVSALMQLAGTFEGAPFGGPFRYTRVWVKRAESWRVVAGHVGAVSA